MKPDERRQLERRQRARLNRQATAREQPSAASGAHFNVGQQVNLAGNRTAATAHCLIGYCGCLVPPYEWLPGDELPLLRDSDSGFPLVAGTEEALLDYARRLETPSAEAVGFVFVHAVMSLARRIPLAMDETAYSRFEPLARTERLNVYSLEGKPTEPLHVRLLLVFPFMLG